MNTILPRFINFNRNTSLFYTDWRGILYLIITIASIALPILFIILAIKAKIHIETDAEPKTANEYMHISLKHISLILLFAISICSIIISLMINRDYNERGFKIPNTNLMASSSKLPTNFHTNNLGVFENRRQSDYYLYVNLTNTKPTNIKEHITNETAANAPVINDNDGSIYLGKIVNGKFLPNNKNAKVAHSFGDYQRYIINHKLEHHFKRHFSFEVSHNYFSKDDDPMLIVVGDNNFTLHYKPNSEGKYNDIVQSIKN